MKEGEWERKRTVYFEYGEVENQQFMLGSTHIEVVTDPKDAWFGTGLPYDGEKVGNQ